MEKLKVVIKRSEWGTGAEGGNLLNARGKKCCLGFICEQAFGVEQKHLLGAGYFPFDKNLENVRYETESPAVKEAVQYYTETSMRVIAAGINDSNRPREEIESELLKLFADSPFDVSFVD